jgi:SAM-dependent methyltransferase
MSNYENRFELINDKCSLIKSKILDIGSKNGADLVIFYQHGFTQLLGIDNNIDRYSSSNMFVEHLLRNKEIIFEENKFYFANSPAEKYGSIYDLYNFIRNNQELKSRFDKLQSEITLRQVDFRHYPREFDHLEEFNLVMCSFVLHFYPTTEDKELINKLKSFLSPNGYLYLKVHNLNRFDTYKNKKTDNQLENVIFDKTLMTIKDIKPKNNKEIIWYLFDDKRIKNYIKTFELIYLGPEKKDFIELILQNRK